MITPAYAPTATERVLPRMALDFTTGVLDPRVTVTRALNTATRVNASGLIETVNANLPRFDYNPSTLAARGLLIEELRANLLTYSEQFDNAAWTKSGVVISANTATAPDGTQTADSFTDDAVNSGHLSFESASIITSGTTYTLSVFAKASTATVIQVLGRAGTMGVNVWANFNLSNGTIGSVGSSTTASITDFGNGWYRCTVTGAAIGTGIGAFALSLTNNSTTALRSPTYIGTGTGTFIWGAQLEAGAFATSYIPTTTTSLTRNADAVSMTGTNFSDWYNASAGTLAVSATGYNAATVAQGGVAPTAVSLYAIAATSPYASIAIVRRDAATLNSPTGYILSDTGTIGADIQKNTISWVGATVNAAIAWNGSTNAAFTANGLTVGTDTSYTLPTSDSLQIGRWGSESISGYWSGHIRKVSFYPQRLTNAELQAITT